LSSEIVRHVGKAPFEMADDQANGAHNSL
jgi:hypothetical protein